MLPELDRTRSQFYSRITTGQGLATYAGPRQKDDHNLSVLPVAFQSAAACALLESLKWQRAVSYERINVFDAFSSLGARSSHSVSSNSSSSSSSGNDGSNAARGLTSAQHRAHGLAQAQARARLAALAVLRWDDFQRFHVPQVLERSDGHHFQKRHQLAHCERRVVALRRAGFVWCGGLCSHDGSGGSGSGGKRPGFQRARLSVGVCERVRDGHVRALHAPGDAHGGPEPLRHGALEQRLERRLAADGGCLERRAGRSTYKCH